MFFLSVLLSKWKNFEYLSFQHFVWKVRSSCCFQHFYENPYFPVPQYVPAYQCQIQVKKSKICSFLGSIQSSSVNFLYLSITCKLDTVPGICVLILQRNPLQFPLLNTLFLKFSSIYLLTFKFRFQICFIFASNSLQIHFMFASNSFINLLQISETAICKL